MKTSQIFKLSVLLLFTVSAIFLNGCNVNSPVTPSETSMEMSSTGKEIKFISLGDANVKTLDKATYQGTWIDQYQGGTLHLHHTSNPVEVVVDLKIAPNTISQSSWVSAYFDDHDNIGNADLVFGPHGTTFSTPAKLTMECKNLDLSGVNPDDIKFYYLNENGVWEEHPCHEIFVDPSWGFVRIVDAEIPHFSRYAIGTE